MNIEFEKLFSRFFIATKKRYVGYDEITKENLYVGMEAIRGDWTDLAQKFQRDIVDLIWFPTGGGIRVRCRGRAARWDD